VRPLAVRRSFSISATSAKAATSLRERGEDALLDRCRSGSCSSMIASGSGTDLSRAESLWKLEPHDDALESELPDVGRERTLRSCDE
jgi:hypothetical protein